MTLMTLFLDLTGKLSEPAMCLLSNSAACLIDDNFDLQRLIKTLQYPSGHFALR